jgi:hypothetical protein
MLAGILGHVIDGFTAKINEITAEEQKESRNSAFPRNGKCLFDSAVES